MTAVTHLPLATPTGSVFSTGDVQFVTPGVKVELCSLHGSAGLLEVEVLAPPWVACPPSGAPRGGLRQAIDQAIEVALEARGAPAPGVGDVADLDQSLSDQLYRARLVGARGLLVYIPNLAAAANLAAALDAEDSAVLRWWIAAVAERPIVLLLHEANRAIGAYGPPSRLDFLVKSERPELRSAAGSAPLPVALTVLPPPAAEEHDADPEPRTANAPVLRLSLETEEGSSALPLLERSAGASLSPVDRQLLPIFPRPDSSFLGKSMKAGGLREAACDWRMCANDLRVARGPKPLTLVERLFMSRYAPLVEAIASGEVDDGGREVAEQWADSFARSYTEGFSALRVTGKRPRMVLDAPQLTSQIARLHGAKSAQLVLVDALRFDLGLRVHDRMRTALGSQATCTERLLLWAALPTTTAVQLDLLAHGPEGLASRATPSEREEPAAQRGRSAPVLRRVRVGSRDLMKLDWVESKLREAGPPLSERLDAVADEIAPTLVAFARSLAPRTLMFVFGDHGFRMESRGGGTLPAIWGGATPDEVLVPGFAWLIGEMH
jgi:hypothetical protein